MSAPPEQETHDPAAARRAGRIWGLAIVAGLASVVVVNFWVYWLVKDQPVALVTPAYYDSGLAYDQVIAQGARNRSAGLEMRVLRNGQVRLLAFDQPVVPRQAKAAYYRADQPQADFETTLSATADGALVPDRMPGIPGLWTVTLFGVLDDLPLQISARYFHRGSDGAAP